MNKKLGRMFWPGLWAYFTVTIGFVVAAVLLKQYLLAGAEAAATVLLLVFYMVSRERRRKVLQSFAKTAFRVPDNPGGAETPFGKWCNSRNACRTTARCAQT